MSAPDDTRQRILDTAGEVFAEKGYEKSTVRDIIGRAGVKNQAAVNYHFGDKEGLYRATLENAFKCGRKQMDIPEGAGEATPREKLRELIRSTMLHLCAPQHAWQMQLLMREISEPTAAGTDFVRRFILPIYERLWEALREALPADASEEEVHLISFSIMGQGFYHRVNRLGLVRIVGEEEYDRLGLERIAAHIAEFSVAALDGYRPPPTPGATV